VSQGLRCDEAQPTPSFSRARDVWLWVKRRGGNRATALPQKEERGIVGLRTHNPDRSDGASFGELDMERPDKCSCDQDQFGERKLCADADARPETEWNVSAASRGRGSWHKARRVEIPGFSPKPAMPVEHPRRDQHQRTRSDLGAADDVVGDGLAHDHEGWRIQPQNLIHRRAGANELRQRIGRSCRLQINRVGFPGDEPLVFRRVCEETESAKVAFDNVRERSGLPSKNPSFLASFAASHSAIVRLLSPPFAITLRGAMRG
jgi:hypothetical protein